MYLWSIKVLALYEDKYTIFFLLVLCSFFFNNALFLSVNKINGVHVSIKPISVGLLNLY